MMCAVGSTLYLYHIPYKWRNNDGNDVVGGRTLFKMLQGDTKVKKRRFNLKMGEMVGGSWGVPQS
jgi:hypothetical protein